jgi:hypothetical protein
VPLLGVPGCHRDTEDTSIRQAAADRVHDGVYHELVAEIAAVVVTPDYDRRSRCPASTTARQDRADLRPGLHQWYEHYPEPVPCRAPIAGVERIVKTVRRQRARGRSPAFAALGSTRLA